MAAPVVYLSTHRDRENHSDSTGGDVTSSFIVSALPFCIVYHAAPMCNFIFRPVTTSFVPFYHRRFLVSLLVDYADQLSPPVLSPTLYCGPIQPPAIYTRPNSNPERIAHVLSLNRKFDFLSREIITKNIVVGGIIFLFGI